MQFIHELNPEQFCPKCKARLKFYDGCCGYEAIVCTKCGYYTDLENEGQDNSYIGMK
jgi:DNA-directed RNA polymerase subunit M/transcription elongation factor TFIIS